MAEFSQEDRTKLVDGLIANCDCWSEEDRGVLNSFTDEKLTAHMKLVVEVANKKAAGGGSKDPMPPEDEELSDEEKKKKEAEVDNAVTLTAEEWLEQAPPEVQNTFRYAHQIETEQKDNIIGQLTSHITDNAEKKIQEERLRGRNLEDLRNDLTLLPPKPVVTEQAVNTATEDDSKWLSQVVSKMGKQHEDEPLLLPTMNFDGSTEEQVGVVADSSNLTAEEWLRQAQIPQGVKSVVKNAMQIDARERDEIITRLISNVEDTNQRFRMRDRLEQKSMDELQEMLALVGNSPAPKTTPPNYAGASAPATDRRMSDEERDDILPLPTMNFKQA